MNQPVKRTHHTALRPTKENFERTLAFYTELLGFTADDQWIWNNEGREIPCAMVNPGDGVMIEIFGGGSSDQMPIGSYPHVCYEADDVIGLMQKLEAAGYGATDPQGEPSPQVYTDYLLRESPRILWRCAFIKGPCGEVIEFLQDLP